jgi:hypothetical protein
MLAIHVLGVLAVEAVGDDAVGVQSVDDGI